MGMDARIKTKNYDVICNTTSANLICAYFSNHWAKGPVHLKEYGLTRKECQNLVKYMKEKKKEYRNEQVIEETIDRIEMMLLIMNKNEKAYYSYN